MANIYKNIKNQIARQTRDKLGFVKFNSKTGVSILKQQPVVTEISQEEEVNYTKWRKIFGNVSRNGNTYIVPVGDVNTYANTYPNKQYLVDYFDFYDIRNTPDINFTYIEIQETKESGSLFVKNIQAFENANYQYSILGNNITDQYVNLSIKSNHLAISVWVDYWSYDVPTSGIYHEYAVLYSSDVNGLSNTVNITVPVGYYGSTIQILTYNPDLTNTVEIPVIGISTIATDSYLSITMDANNLVSPINNITGVSPSWGSVPIVTSVNPVTGNVINELYFDKEDSSDWDEIFIYRRISFEDFIVEKSNNNKLLLNNLILDTSDKSNFNGNCSLSIANTDEYISGSMISYANGIINSDFSNLTLNRPDNWTYQCTTIGTIAREVSTVYPYYGNYIYNGVSLRMNNVLTDTSKSQYIETNYLAMDTSCFISLYYLDEYKRDTGYLKTLYYTSSDGTLSSILDSALVSLSYYSNAVYSLDSSNVWYQTKIKLDGAPLYPPNDAEYVKIRLYSIAGDTCASSYLIDGIHYGEMDGYYFFHTSMSDKVVLQLKDNKGCPISDYTVGNFIFNDTSKSYFNDIYADNSYNQPYYITNTAWGAKIKFDYSIGLFDSSHNFLQNGDLSGGFSGHWATSSGIEAKLMTSNSLFSNNYIKVFNHIKDGTGSFYTYQTLSGYDNSRNLKGGFWLRSSVPNSRVKLALYDSVAHLSSAWFILNNDWKKCEIDTIFATSVAYTPSLMIYPDSNTSDFDIAGAFLSYSDDVEYINTNSTSGGYVLQGKQGLYYQQNINSEFGTIRMWYTPMLNENTGKPYNSLYFQGSVDNYKSLYYDKYNKAFIFRQYDGVDYHNCILETSLPTNSPIHIVATWDDNDTYLYINNQKTSSALTVTTTDSSGFYLGIHAPSYTTSYSANGFISNFRIDKYTWDKRIISNDYLTNDYIILPNSTVSGYLESYLGSKKINSSESEFKYTDNVGLKPNTSYSYVFKVKDTSGDFSLLSTLQSITTKRKPFEQNSVNKISNSAFEVSQSSFGTPLYWDTAGDSLNYCVVSEDYYFVGTKSIKIRGGGAAYPIFQQNYLVVTDTAQNLSLSWYSYSPESSYVDNLRLIYLDAGFNHVATVLASGLEGTLSSSYSKIGIDNNIWRRYSTTLPYSSATFKLSKYISIGFYNNSPYYGYLDAVQAEIGSITDYNESDFIQDGNLGSNVIDGNALSFDAIIGKHFRAGEILVNENDQDATRIIIGDYNSSSDYSIFTPTHIMHHQSNMATAVGYRYPRHIESGYGIFGNNVSFEYPYLNMFGEVTTPHIVVTPTEIKTFDSGYPTSSQKFRVIKYATASGFYVNAYLEVDNVAYDEYLYGATYLIDRDGSHSTLIQSENNVGVESYGV